MSKKISGSDNVLEAIDEAVGIDPQAHSYNPVSKFFHWISALIWITAWVLGMVAVYGRDLFNQDHSITMLHKAIASTLLFLIVLRVLWRMTHATPPLPDTMSAFMKRGAVVGHYLLYAFALLALPVSGWFWSSVAGRPVMVAGLFQLPPLTGADKSLYPLAKQIHWMLAWAMGAMVGGHILIALKHHFIDRDFVLLGMLPDTFKKKSR